jgi:hypothetical protein
MQTCEPTGFFLRDYVSTCAIVSGGNNIGYLEFIELQTGVGDAVTLSVLRAGQEIAIEATAIAQPQ